MYSPGGSGGLDSAQDDFEIEEAEEKKRRKLTKEKGSLISQRIIN